MSRSRFIFFLPILLLALLFIGESRLAAPTAFAAPQATTLTVTNTNDSGAGSLRQAIADSTPGDIIQFSLADCPCTIALNQELSIAHDLEIQGPNANQLRLDGQNNSRVLSITGGTVSISGLTIRNGSSANGGGILNQADLDLTNVDISNNTASMGGGIYNDDGAILRGSGLLISYNQATGSFGGGIFNIGDGAVYLTNSTLTNNHAADDAGAIYNNDNNYVPSANVVSLLNVTITGNATDSDAGGIDNFGKIQFKNTLLAGNSAPGMGPDCRNVWGHPYYSLGHNLVGTNQDCSFTAASGDLVGTSSAPLDPRLAELASNGGPTSTVALLPGSPALNTGSSANCPTTDQRGSPRPISAACDIGAYEQFAGSSDLGIFIWNVKLNGSYSPVTVNPGESINVTLDYQIWESDAYCPGCISQLVDGYDNTALGTCIYDGGPGVLPGASGSYINSFAAPLTPGTYSYRIKHDWQYGCDQFAIGGYSEAASTEYATFVVSGVVPTDTPTSTPTDTPTPTFTPTATPTFTPTYTPTNTPTDAPTNTPTPTPTNTPEPPAQFNSAWIFAQRVHPDVTLQDFLKQPDESRWYKFSISPRSKVTITLTDLPADYNLVVYKDILKAYNQDLTALNNPNPDEELKQLGAEFAPEAFSPEAFSPEAFSPEAFSPEAFSPEAFSPEAFSPEAFSPEAFSPEAFSPEAFSPEAFSPEAFSSAQMKSIVGVSAFPGTAGEGISINTWDNTGDFYVRVRGANGAYDPYSPFTLRITIESSDCTGVQELTQNTSLTASSVSKSTLILTDWNRMPGSTADINALAEKLNALAAATNGVVVDVGQDARVNQANAQADAHLTCPAAKNLVALAVKDIINLYDANESLENIVLVGGDAVIPFFRQPDQALLAAEGGYVPPVRDATSSQASLRLNYFLTQDPYASRLDISRGNNTLAVPAIAIGRLVETPNEISGVIEAYLSLNNGVTPLTTNALVTGYDFLADAAESVKGELEAGMGVNADALIAPRDAAPTDPISWTADDLRAQLLGQRHDIVFLAGHFSQGSALAADWATNLRARQVAQSNVDLTNAILFSAGCHSGYNVVDADAVNGVTLEPDWAQAFARKRATFIGGTGYQYGDTDVIEYTERLLEDFARQLRAGSGPVSVGQALVRAKQNYLANTPQPRGIHDKSLLQVTLFGLPMLKVDMPGQRAAQNHRAAPEIAVNLNTFGSDPGATLNLKYADVTLNPALTQKSVTYKQTTDNSPVVATYFNGPNGIVSNPTEPILPLLTENVSAPNNVLRGVGFRGGSYTDVEDILPATGAPATEIRGVHAPFPAQVFFPIRIWSVNYFAALAQNGATRLMLTPAQYRAYTADPTRGTWRKYSQVDLRLYYNNNLTNYTNNANVASVPALSAAPALSEITATANGNQIHFRARAVGNPAAGIQEVWVTYTGTSGDLYGTWQSLNLTQDDTDSTVWEGALTLGGTSAQDLRFMAQAVNGVGLVTLAANLGKYYTPVVLDGPARGPANTALEFENAPSSGKYGNTATFTAVLTSEGAPVAGKFIYFGLGAQQRGAVTNANGKATVSLSLLTNPGNYNVKVSFPGDADYGVSSNATPFQITKQNTHMTLTTPHTDVQYSDVADLLAMVRDESNRALGQVSVAFLAVNPNDTQATTAITNFASEARVTNIPFKAGAYDVTASFGNVVSINGADIDLSDARYNASSANGNLTIIAENATVEYTGATTVPANGNLELAATVTQEDDGHPGDLRLARVQYELYDENAQLVDSLSDNANANGKSSATLENVAGGSYTLKVSVSGGYFTSESVEIPVLSASIHLSQNIRFKNADAQNLAALRAQFKSDSRETGFKLTDTKPQTFQYVQTLNNTGNVPLNVEVTINLPNGENPALSPAFCLVGANPVQVFADADLTRRVDKNVTSTPATPIADANETTQTCASSVTLTLNVPANAKRYVTLRLEFAGKGATGFDKRAANQYAQGFLFSDIVTNDSLSAPLENTSGLALVSQRATAIGGFALENGAPRSGLVVRVMQGNTKIGQTKTDANGFFIVRVKPGGPYRVELLDPTTNDVLATAEIDSIAKREFRRVNLK